MRLFIDVLGPGGAYRASITPVVVDSDGIAGELVLPRFLEALGYKPLHAGHRLFHLERLRYIHRADARDIRDLHTVVVVRSTDPILSEPGTIRALWEVTGGPGRRGPLERPTTPPSGI